MITLHYCFSVNQCLGCHMIKQFLSGSSDFLLTIIPGFFKKKKNLFQDHFFPYDCFLQPVHSHHLQGPCFRCLSHQRLDGWQSKKGFCGLWFQNFISHSPGRFLSLSFSCCLPPVDEDFILLDIPPITLISFPSWLCCYMCL